MQLSASSLPPPGRRKEPRFVRSSPRRALVQGPPRAEAWVGGSSADRWTARRCSKVRRETCLRACATERRAVGLLGRASQCVKNV
eukprot:2426274-Alexandrium_andersonii.AAC.1